MRDYTNKITEMAEDGSISWETIAREALERMSEDEVESMCVECDWITPDDFDDEDEDEDEDDLEDEEEDGFDDEEDEEDDLNPDFDGPEYDEPEDEESEGDSISW